MNSVSGENGARGQTSIRLCPRCRRETLPACNGPSWAKHAHRGDGAHAKVAPPDPAAERIRLRKLKKKDRARLKERAALRREFRAGNITGAITLFLAGDRAFAPVPISEECVDCQRLQERAARHTSTRVA